MLLLIKLLLAHFLGDFILQPGKWVKDKMSGKLRSRGLYLHFFVHIILVFLIVWDFSLWLPLSLYLLVHFGIDILKIYMNNEKNQRRWFFVDQGLHLLSIVIFWLIMSKLELNWKVFLETGNLTIITAVVFLTFPSSVIIREFMRGWSDNIEDDETGSLKNAGKYIGMLERLFVFLFFMMNQWIAIGFLITAKSVFRFGDLRQTRDRKLTEYILIGTLTSFGFAFVAGLLTELVISGS